MTAAAIVGASAFAVANTGTGTDADTENAAADVPPYAVEDFGYPGADKILVEQGITLKRGDGRITLAACDDAADQLKVLTRVGAGEFCFKVTSSTGYLALELADVFAIQTESHPVRAELTAEGVSKIVDVPKNDFKGVGEGVNEPPTVLLELRITG
ncbi:hypothetical protein RB628_22505 [Streptomyces sp. ADMS]|uniref:hypothetical protein n=1 Tax=Streptomyces sp. ADMS TaxID=3071415 RepID=UPI00296E9302|nr:hypothetical protein [Streptomyces sp. ADMS]MDW4908040.1 hypothetical protein [Streptomyces sp. ADMS]